MRNPRKRFEALDKAWAINRLTTSTVAGDAWPYTATFDEALEVFNSAHLQPWTKSEFWQLLLAARKVGLSRQKKASATSSPPIDPSAMKILRKLLPRSRGAVDRLPYTSAFDELVKQFRHESRSKLTDAEIWRACLRIAKAAIHVAARPLFEKAVCNLRRAVHEFNREDEGRFDAVIVGLHFAFEMLLKAAIVQRRRKIHDPTNAAHTIKFGTCVDWALTLGDLAFLDFESAQFLKLLNKYRGDAYHFLLELDEAELYVITRGMVDLFAKICDDVFQQSLAELVPNRVLPISTIPLNDVLLLIDRKRDQILALLQRGERRRAMVAARSIVLLNMAAGGDADLAPTDADLASFVEKVRRGGDVAAQLPSIAALKLNAPGCGPEFSLSFKGKASLPVLGMPTTIDQPVVAYKLLDPRNTHPFTHTNLAEKSGVNVSNLTWVVRELGLQSRPDCCYMHGPASAGGNPRPGYSQKAIQEIKSFLTKFDGNWRHMREKHTARQR